MTRQIDMVEIADPDRRGKRRPNPIDAHVGVRVRGRRMWLGLSQEKLAEKLGLTFQQVQKYEKGINRMSASRLFDLARVLKVDVQYFYDDLPASGFAEGEEQIDGSTVDDEVRVRNFLGTKEGLELNKAFSLLDPAVRKPILDMVRSMADKAKDETG